MIMKILDWLKVKKHQKYLFWTGTFCIGLIVLINCWVIYWSHNFIHKDFSKVPNCHTGIILGAFINQKGVPSYALRDRLETGISLYKEKKIKRILLSGDHGTKEYDEVNHMKNYLVKNGIPTKDIFLDHAGFDTYQTMVRAKKVFLVKNAIVITQAFHLPRAVYLAKSQGLIAYGMRADKRKYHRAKWYEIREVLARIKAFLEVVTNKKPTYLGEEISIYDESKASYD